MEGKVNPGGSRETRSFDPVPDRDAGDDAVG